MKLKLPTVKSISVPVSACTCSQSTDSEPVYNELNLDQGVSGPGARGASAGEESDEEPRESSASPALGTYRTKRV